VEARTYRADGGAEWEKVQRGRCCWQRVVGREQGKGRFKPMFVQFVLENLWAVYDAAMLRPYASFALHGVGYGVYI